MRHNPIPVRVFVASALICLIVIAATDKPASAESADQQFEAFFNEKGTTYEREGYKSKVPAVGLGKSRDPKSGKVTGGVWLGGDSGSSNTGDPDYDKIRNFRGSSNEDLGGGVFNFGFKF